MRFHLGLPRPPARLWPRSLCCHHPTALGTTAVANTLLSAVGKENCPHLLRPNAGSLQAPLEVWHREPGLLQVSAGMRSALAPRGSLLGSPRVGQCSTVPLCPTAPGLPPTQQTSNSAIRINWAEIDSTLMMGSTREGFWAGGAAGSASTWCEAVLGAQSLPWQCPPLCFLMSFILISEM